MRLRHFETLRPFCPTCREADGSGAPLRIARVVCEQENHILQGILHCSSPQCQREYPIIDGIPLLLGDLRRFVTDHASRLLSRTDLHPDLESLIGDCLGPGSDFDASRQQVSSYCWEHYGDFDPGGDPDGDMRGTLLAALGLGLELAGALPDGPLLDLGCGPGRSAFELAQRTGRTVLGVDLHLPMLRFANRLLTTGTASYDLRRVGLVYERREFPVDLTGAERVDFWACDAAALPFEAGTFAAATALNLLDCVYSPQALLASLATVLHPGGRTILTTPYDWSPGATPVEGWIGGHSQRGPLAGSSDATLRALLGEGDGASAIPLRLVAERDGVPWRVRLHDRAFMEYRLHLLVTRRQDDPDG